MVVQATEQALAYVAQRQAADTRRLDMVVNSVVGVVILAVEWRNGTPTRVSEAGGGTIARLRGRLLRGDLVLGSGEVVLVGEIVD